MKIAVLGTGEVGRRLASKLVEVGHDVRMGSRTADNEKATAWASEAGDAASHGTFADAAAFAELVVNASSGKHSLEVLEAAGEALDGKVLVDVSNPLDFSNGFPPSLTVCSDDSLAEQIQRAHPAAKVVKALNTLSNVLMVDPRKLDGTHHTFVSSDHDDAKKIVGELLESFDWRPEEIFDLGPLSTARGTEAWLLMWTRIYGAKGNAMFNMRLVFGETPAE